MNVKYVAKNPTPVAQTITLPQGMPLDGGRLRSAEAITVQVPPMSVREILYDQEGMPVVEGCIQDLTVTVENNDGTPIDPHTSRRERTVIRDVSGDRTALFMSQTRRVYPNLVVDDNRNIGGAQLLAQFSHLRSQRDNTTAIYSPAALNMTLNPEPTASTTLLTKDKWRFAPSSATVTTVPMPYKCKFTIQDNNPSEWLSLKGPWSNSKHGPVSKIWSLRKTYGSISSPVKPGPSLFQLSAPMQVQAHPITTR